MSYWGPAEDQQLHGSFAAYPAEYAPYFNTMAYYNDGPNDPAYPLSTTYYNNYESDAASYSGAQPGPSQDVAANMYNIGVFNGDDLNRNSGNSGAVRKQNNDKKKQWNSGRKNDQQRTYGSGRTFNNRTSSRPDYGNWHKDERKRAVQETADFLRSFNNQASDNGGGEKENVARATYSRSGNQNPKANDGGRYQSSKYRDSYDDSRRSNFKSRDYSDSRSYGRYNKSNNSRYYESNGQGNGDGREGYVAKERGEKNSWRRSGKCNDAKQSKKKLDAASQRERLEQMLTQRILECLVCCEKVKHTDKIWTCQQCYLILHLSCTIAWADSSKLENGWRCPACQNVCSEVPKQYFCYCGKVQEPRPIPGVIPHACGDSCLKKGRTCEHKCPMLCHPGPCPDCNIMVAKSCGCGATKQTTKCSSDMEIVCGAVCDKPLDCGLHKCQAQCHPGPCSPCTEFLRQICYCGKEGRRVGCTSEFQGSLQYACGEPCDKLLACGNHRCDRPCHEGDCDGCSRSVEVVQSCPCGKSKLKQVRTSCLDPIPCCDKVCL